MVWFNSSSVGRLLASSLALAATARAATGQTAVSAASSAVARYPDGAARGVTARRASASIVLDGRLDDLAWASASVAGGFVQQRPTPGASASARTEVRVLFDATSLYVAMRMTDPRPDSILAPLGRRDYDGYGDWAHVIIDSYHDGRTAFHFAVNPAGTRRDGMISNDVEWQEDLSWDAVWDAATSRDSLGWTAEFRIPLTQLRFGRCRAARNREVALSRADSTSASCVWGIQFVRDLGRRNERSLWAPIAPNVGGYVSRFGVLTGIDAIRAPRRLEVVPYTIAHGTRTPADATNPFVRRTAIGTTLGADLGLGVTSKLSLTATVNPDFGQVEADPSEVNLTGSETFLRERRPFFVEGSEIFRYPLGDGFFFGEEELFHSRRIGRAPQVSDPDGAEAVYRPAATSIIGAAKLSGKAGSWAVGLLDAVTGAERGRVAMPGGVRRTFVAEPAANYAIARASRDGMGGRSSVGLVATAVHRDLAPDAKDELRSDALAAGIDGRFATRDRNYTFGGNLLASYVRGSEAAITETQRSTVHLAQRPDASGGRLDTTRASLAGLSAEVRASKVGGGHWRWGGNGRVVSSGFEVNDLGFQLRSDVASSAGWVGYSHFEPGRTVRQWSIWSNHWGRWTLDGLREQLASNVWVEVAFQSNWRWNAEVRREYSRISPTLLRGGPAAYLPPNVTWWGRLASDPGAALSGEIVTQGYRDDVGGGRRVAFFPVVTLHPSARVELSLQPGVAHVTNPSQYVATASAAGDTSYIVGTLRQTTTSLTARLNLTFTPALSLQLYAQPFLSAGGYRALGEVRAARSRRRDQRVAYFAPAAIGGAPDDMWRIDRGAGREPVAIDAPDFTARDLRSNAVLRWEYRPGSALFLVWGQTRDEGLSRADFSAWRQAADLWRTPATNVLLLKASYWIAPR